MARKTREQIQTERLAQIEAYRLQYYNDNNENWTKRVLSVIREAQNVRVADNLEGFMIEFFVSNPSNPNDYFVDEGYLPVNLKLSDDVQDFVLRLEGFEWRIEDILREREEAERNARIRREALAKLTEEERKALGV